MLVWYRFKNWWVLIVSLVLYVLLFFIHSIIVSAAVYINIIFIWIKWLNSIRISNNSYFYKILILLFTVLIVITLSIFPSIYTNIWFLSKQTSIILGVFLISILYLIVNLYYLSRYYHTFYTFEALIILFSILGYFAINSIYTFAVLDIFSYNAAKLITIFILNIFILLLVYLLENKWLLLGIVFLSIVTIYSKMPFFWYILDFLIVNTLVFIWELNSKISDIERKFQYNYNFYGFYKFLIIIVLLLYLKLVFNL